MNPIKLALSHTPLAQGKGSSLLLIALGLVIPALAAKTARLVAGGGYKAITRDKPPKNPAHPDVEWRDAILWTVLSGAIGGLGRLAARRWLAGSSVPAEGYDLEEKAERL